jgi:signal transduction histidine kinase
VVGIVIVATDITTRKILEQQLDQLKHFASLGEITAGVAHEIKNPLMSIRGCSRLLQKELVDNPEYSKLVEPIIHEVDRINAVVEQMISYGHITKQTNYALIDVNEVLEKSITVVHFHQGSKYITIRKELAAGLPFARGHNVQLQLAFINILINAVQAIEQEGIIHIKTNYDKDRKCIRISIADNGQGIAVKDLRKVFRPFYTTKQSGKGLGLSIVNRVIKDHRGKITITSKLHQGTDTEVYLPC